jgi:hypothetical protein
MGLRHRYQQELNQQGHDLQFDMWNKTNYGAQVKHMLEAGLNPALMYGSAGQGGSTGSQTGGSAGGGSAAPFKVMDLQNMLVGADLKIKGSQNEKLQTEIDDLKSQISERDGVKKDFWKASTENKALDSEYKRLQNMYYPKEIETTIREIGQRTANLKQQFNLTEEQWEGKVNQAIGDGLSALNRANNITADTRLKYEQIQEIEEKLSIAYNQLELDSAKVGIAMEAVSYEKIKTMVYKEYEGLKLDQRKREMWADNGTRLLTEFIRGAFGIATAGVERVTKKN